MIDVQTNKDYKTGIFSANKLRESYQKEVGMVCVLETHTFCPQVLAVNPLVPQQYP